MSKNGKIVEAVGISANTMSPDRKPIANAIQTAMTQAAEHARRIEKITDQDEIRRRMLAAREAVRRGDWEPPSIEPADQAADSKEGG